MSRSYKKTPIHGMTNADTEKFDKKVWHRAFRRKTKSEISKSHYDLEHLSETILPDTKEESNTCLMRKDGKKYWNPQNVPEQVIEYFKKLMRK